MTDAREPAIGADDPRRPDLLELRARQVLALALETGNDTAPLATVWTAAMGEFGHDSTVLLGAVLGLVGVHLSPAARAELAACVRADIPRLLTKIEGDAP
jgi:hypothetical protein